MSRAAPSASFRHQQGFTLLEMLVVLVILGLVTAAIPLIHHGGAELRGLGYELATELRDLRQAAIRTRMVTEFALNSQAGSYQLGDRDVVLPPGVTLSYVVSEPPLVGDALDHLAFYPDGSSPGGTLTLARDGVVIVVAVGWMDGRISIDG